ncbi:uncharacterized protein LOC143035540 isoform X2 [Oratosquilla oratoria]|uniref:uncharacterized protein LOC143035540 isoform X2 n=1 Tax=Oratosquilla oratoria TaxID=337810 RepID=UPI003F76DD3D
MACRVIVVYPNKDLVMGADQFLLTWNNHRSNFADVFSQLRVQEQLVDVTLLCDGGSYPAHRLVLSACSPYFHQLFSRLPTQHPLVYLRDVKQAELEALLEFIYRGEVSVANSELTGLIKIAESLRIKGLGDVSHHDHQPRGEKRTASPLAAASAPITQNPLPRPSKAAKVISTATEEKKHDNVYSNLLSSANSYGHAKSRNSAGKATKDTSSDSCFAQLMETSQSYPTGSDSEECESEPQEDPIPLVWDKSRSGTPESKLRSRLEEQPEDCSKSASQNMQPLNLARTFFNLNASKVSSSQQPIPPKQEVGEVAGAPVHGSSRRKNSDPVRSPGSKKDSLKVPHTPAVSHQDSRVQTEADKMPIPNAKIKNEVPSSEVSAPSQLPVKPESSDTSAMLAESGLTPTLQLFETTTTDLTNSPLAASPFLSTYRHMLSLTNTEEATPSFPSCIPTTVQEISPSTNKEPKSMTCQLCGATIKHIANFRRHMKQHLNPRRFPCPWCSAAFGRKDNLKTHTRKHHPVEVEAQEAAAASGTITNTTIPPREDGDINGDCKDDDLDHDREMAGLETGGESPNVSSPEGGKGDDDDEEDGDIPQSNLVIVEDDMEK